MATAPHAQELLATAAARQQQQEQGVHDTDALLRLAYARKEVKTVPQVGATWGGIFLVFYLRFVPRT